jgi:predicted adenylyl cyclase CyaB
MYKEIEYKYDAKNTSFKSFDNFIKTLEVKDHFFANSYDYFFTRDTFNEDVVRRQGSHNPDDFIRYRFNDTSQELTFKKKTSDLNNQNRIEINLNIKELDKNKIKKFLEMIGFLYRFQIYKTCFIYIFDKIIVSYYIVYDENINELGRFIEIEADEKYDWKDDSEAFQKINDFEKLFHMINITSKDRLTKSLFEMFVPRQKILNCKRF